MKTTCFLLAACSFAAALVQADDKPPQTIESKLIHLRSGAEREWTEFPAIAHGPRYETRFTAEKNDRATTLQLRQQDVKQAWRVLLNGKQLGQLLPEERDALRYFAVEGGQLLAGENTLRIEPAGKHALSDDIRIGEIALHATPLAEWLEQSHVEIEVVDAQSGQPLPCCLAIVDRHGSLVPVGAKSNEHLAVRTGIVYTSTGKASFGLPRGTYTLYAGRGFEYSRGQAEITLADAHPQKQRFELRREVPVPGYVACDTHIHTLTYSGHGDATIDERMITLAGEGIELPIATDHNVHIDYESHARRMGVRRHFTPVMGNEVTTKVGHFNVFPVASGAAVVDAKLADWPAIFKAIYATPDVRVCILNHARDLHSGTRPFGPILFNAAVAEQLEGWPLHFNAMEVINSGATQNDPLRLFHDWMALLNRGCQLTPVGSSDSHDVARHFVGQGRTYIRTPDDDPGQIDVRDAIDAFVAGRVLVSYGLLAELQVDGKHRSGDLVPPRDGKVRVEITVRGPSWIAADRIQLYANGQLLREEKIAEPSGELPPGVKWQATWQLDRPGHDVHLVAIALGPGIAGAYWHTARPYQPTSPEWTPYTLGCSGAVWLDADGDGRRTSARDYAERLWTASDKQAGKLLGSLANYDAAVAAHAAHLYRAAGGDLESQELADLLKQSGGPVRRGFADYFRAWRESTLARAAK